MHCMVAIKHPYMVMVYELWRNNKRKLLLWCCMIQSNQAKITITITNKRKLILWCCVIQSSQVKKKNNNSNNKQKKIVIVVLRDTIQPGHALSARRDSIIAFTWKRFLGDSAKVLGISKKETLDIRERIIARSPC